MTRRPATWKIVTLGAALTGLGVAGAGLASADDQRTGSLPEGVTVTAPVADDAAQSAVDSPDDSTDVVAVAPAADASPESADSPTESVVDSPDASPDTASPDIDSPDIDSPDTDSPDASPDLDSPDTDSPDLDSADSPA